MMDNNYLKYTQERKNDLMLKDLKNFGITKEVRIRLVKLAEVRKSPPTVKQSLRVSLPIAICMDSDYAPSTTDLAIIDPMIAAVLSNGQPSSNISDLPMPLDESYTQHELLSMLEGSEDITSAEVSDSDNWLNLRAIRKQETNEGEMDPEINPFKIPKLKSDHAGTPNASTTDNRYEETKTEDMEPKRKISESHPDTPNTLTNSLRMVRHPIPITTPGSVVNRNVIRMPIIKPENIPVTTNQRVYTNKRVLERVNNTLPNENILLTEKDPSISMKHKLPVSVVPTREIYGHRTVTSIDKTQNCEKTHCNQITQTDKVSLTTDDELKILDVLTKNGVSVVPTREIYGHRTVTSIDKTQNCEKTHCNQITQTDKVSLTTDDELKIIDVVTKSGVTNDDLVKLLEKHKKIQERTKDAGLVIDVEKDAANNNNNTKPLDMAMYHSEYNKNLLIDVIEKIKKNSRPNVDVSRPAHAGTPLPSTIPPQAPVAAHPPHPPPVSIEPEMLKFLKILHNQYKNNSINALQQILEKTNKEMEMRAEDHSDDISLALDPEVCQNTLNYPTVVAPLIRSQLTQHNEPQQAVPVQQLNQQEVPLQNVPQQQIEQLQCQQETLEQHQLQQQLLQQQQMQKQKPQPKVQQTQPLPRVLLQTEEQEHDRRMFYSHWPRNDAQQFHTVLARNNYPSTYEHIDPINPTQIYLFPGDPRPHIIQSLPRLSPGATRLPSNLEANQNSAHVYQRADYNYRNNQNY